jgi:hypothetical protein
MMADTTPCDSANENSAIDWGECMICQKVTREELRCPSNGFRFDAGAVYEAFAGRFQELRQLSEPNKQHFKLHNLFDQNTLPNITDKMLSNKGKWHNREIRAKDCSHVLQLGNQRTSPFPTVNVALSPNSATALRLTQFHVSSVLLFHRFVHSTLFGRCDFLF